MTELMRPALYGAFHRIEPVAPRPAPRPRSTRSSVRSARAATSSAATACCRRSRSATSSRFATPAPTARRWLRTTTAGRCPPKCWSTTARGASSAAARRSTTCSRSRLTLIDCDRRCSIAFEGLDQSGKQTQAELLRDRLKQDGRKARLVSFPDYGTSIGEEIARALPGEREYGPDVMQLLYVANRYERKAGSAALARRRADPRLRSLHGVEHRLRRGAGARSGVARPTCRSSCRRRR